MNIVMQWLSEWGIRKDLFEEMKVMEGEEFLNFDSKIHGFLTSNNNIIIYIFFSF